MKGLIIQVLIPQTYHLWNANQVINWLAQASHSSDTQYF